MKNNGVKSEKIFEDRMEEAYRKNVFVERLPDTKSIKGAIGSGFIAGRPSDYLVTLRGEMFYAEVKSCSDPVSFPFSNFRKDQWKAMIRQNAAGGKYSVFLHNLLTNEWYRVECQEVLAADQQGRKSIKWSEMSKWVM